MAHGDARLGFTLFFGWYHRTFCRVARCGLLDSKVYAQTNPVPFISQPWFLRATVLGSRGFTLTVDGTGFVPGSVINWSGSPRATNFISSGQLTAAVLTSDLATAARSIAQRFSVED